MPGRGLEPPQIALHAPKACASTNFATPAMKELKTQKSKRILKTIIDFDF